MAKMWLQELLFNCKLELKLEALVLWLKYGCKNYYLIVKCDQQQTAKS